MNGRERELMFELAENLAIDDGVDVISRTRLCCDDDSVMLRVQSVAGHEFVVTLVGEYYGEMLCEVAPMWRESDRSWKWHVAAADVVSFSELSAVGF